MKPIRVSEATNTQLDWLVAKCEGLLPHDAWVKYGAVWWKDYVYSPTTDPARMWPITDREKIATNWRITNAEGGGYWQAENLFTDTYGFIGPTSLIAAARCYVASKLGENVEVPEELT